MTKPFVFWGKSEGEGQGLGYLSVWEHSLNVAAVADAWMEKRPSLWRRWTGLLGLPMDRKSLSTARTIALHFILLHDLGKYDHRFQGKLPVLFERLNGVPISVQGSFDHGGGGLHFYSRFRVETGKITPNKVDWFDFIRATTSHHGRYTQFKKYRAMGKIQDSCLNADLREVFGPERDRAISEHIRRAETLFPLPDFEPFKETMADAMVFLAGLCSVSDWLGSDSRFFPCGPLSRPFTRETFQDDANEAARRLLAANHLLGKYCGKPEAILSRVFPDRNRVVLRPLQETALNMPLSKTPQLVVIEAPMGEGKTEAALMIADRLLAAGSAEKLYFALPTMATANAMYGRMSDIMAEHRFFDEGSSLVLAHGKRNLRQGFRKHILVPHQKENYQDSENPPAQMMCSRFFAQSHKRSLLANVGVGTVDQIMSAVLGGRHHWVKLFGLADSVVIIDEVHAYDAYMRKILGRLIEWLKALGTHVVLLSATLPRVIRRTLAVELDSVAEENDSGEYPLITHLSNGRPPKFIPCKASASAKKTLFFQMTREPDDIIDRLLANARAGAQCCVVLNTVAKAQELFKILRDSEKIDGIELMLFHSRFMLKDRSDMEEAVLSRFGKSGDRSSGRILIATQVVEQSLDVDFDFMVSEIAPIDLLLQRAGRLHRFPWNKTHRRATLWESPQMMVFMPCQGASKLLDDRKENPDARSVYDAAILYRTALLFQNDDAELKVKIPDDIRILVDRVYDREGIDIPSEDSDRHAQSWREWEDMEFAQKTRGAGVLQPAPNGKSCDLGNQTAPGSDPDDVMESQEMTESLQIGGTRFTQPSQTIVFVNDSWLVRRENFAQDPEAYIRFLENVELHSVTVLQDMIRGVDSNSYRLDPNVMTPDEWKNTARQFEKELPAWKGYVLLPLVEGNDDARYEFSAPVVLAYSPSMGLQLEYPSREKRPFFRLREAPVEDPTTGPFDDPANEIRVEKGADKSPRLSKPPSPVEDLKRKVRSNPLKDRISYLHVGRARLDVDDSGLVMTSNEGEAFRQIPVASLTVILLEPGSTVTHEAVKLCALHKCLLIWVGEGGVRLYSAGYSDFSSSEKLLHQANMYHDPAQRLAVVRRMFEIRFQKPCPMNKSVDQLRGMEGQRVKKRYKDLAEKYGIPWDGRFYDPAKWQKADTINRVISTATSCLYGIVEAAILTAGYSPAIGFLHSGKPLSFVYDIADLYKDSIALPLCFELVKEHREVAESMVRHRLRDVFRKERFLEALIPSIEKILEPVDR